MLILPSRYYTFPCKLVVRIWCLTCIVVVCKTISSLDSIIKEPLEQFKLMEEALKRPALSKNCLLDMLLHLHKFSRKEKKGKEKNPNALCIWRRVYFNSFPWEKRQKPLPDYFYVKLSDCEQIVVNEESVHTKKIAWRRNRSFEDNWFLLPHSRQFTIE